jgi:predicted nucleotidyltransferase
MYFHLYIFGQFRYYAYLNGPLDQCRINVRRPIISENDTEFWMAITELVRKCRTALESHYGSQFKGLVLYGSVARDQSSTVGDIDLLVLLSKPFDYFQELRRIVDLLYPVQLDADRLISAKPAPFDEFEDGSIQLYRNARREGVLL